MTLLLSLSAGAVLYIAGKPVLDYVLSYVCRLVVEAV